MDKTVFHKGILRDFFGVTLPVNHSDDVTNDARVSRASNIVL